MKVHLLPLILSAGLLMPLASPAAATPTVLRSPETANTYADNSILWRQLRWLPASRQLVATITFSNIDYISRIEPRHDETFTFPLPGVTFNSDTGLFSLAGKPVARLRRELFTHGIALLPTARILVDKNADGRVSVRLLAGQPSTEGELWVER